MDTHRFLFISGLHRSGTSILFKCLRENSHISGFTDTAVYEDEGQHLQSVYPPALNFGGAGKFGFDSRAHLTENSPLATDENGKKLFDEWSKYWDLSKPILLEKSPPNLIQTRFLQKLFPESYFIVITRHPLAVSYATRKWSKTPILSLVEHWLLCHEMFVQDSQFIKNFMVIRYEDFVGNPQAVFEKIYQFLRIKGDVPDLEVHTGINDHYFSKWREAKKRILSRNFIETVLIRLRFEKRANKIGYSLHDLTKGENYGG